MRLRTCTLGELRDTLEDLISSYGEHKPVVFSSDYGDHSHTLQVHELDGDGEELPIYETVYSVSGWAVREDDGSALDGAYDPPTETLPTVIVLS